MPAPKTFATAANYVHGCTDTESAHSHPAILHHNTGNCGIRGRKDQISPPSNDPPLVRNSLPFSSSVSKYAKLVSFRDVIKYSMGLSANV